METAEQSRGLSLRPARHDSSSSRTFRAPPSLAQVRAHRPGMSQSVSVAAHGDCTDLAEASLLSCHRPWNRVQPPDRGSAPRAISPTGLVGLVSLPRSDWSRHNARSSRSEQPLPSVRYAQGTAPLLHRLSTQQPPPCFAHLGNPIPWLVPARVHVRPASEPSRASLVLLLCQRKASPPPPAGSGRVLRPRSGQKRQDLRGQPPWQSAGLP